MLVVNCHASAQAGHARVMTANEKNFKKLKNEWFVKGTGN
jgi:hypothetical protein